MCIYTHIIFNDQARLLQRAKGPPQADHERGEFKGRQTGDTYIYIYILYIYYIYIYIYKPFVDFVPQRDVEPRAEAPEEVVPSARCAPGARPSLLAHSRESGTCSNTAHRGFLEHISELLARPNYLRIRYSETSNLIWALPETKCIIRPKPGSGGRGYGTPSAARPENYVNYVYV